MMGAIGSDKMGIYSFKALCSIGCAIAVYSYCGK